MSRLRGLLGLLLALASMGLVLFPVTNVPQADAETLLQPPFAVASATDADPSATVFETTIIAQEAVIDFGDGNPANTYTYGGTVPGPEIRVNVGDTVIVHFENQLPDPSSIHFHGIELSNPMDGTPLTQNGVPTGGTFDYIFKVTRPGVFWYHPHFKQINPVFKGQYGSLIVSDPHEDTLRTAGVLPDASDTGTLVLSDTTVCAAPGSNPDYTYPNDPSLPWEGGTFDGHTFAPTVKSLCESPLDNDGQPIGSPLAAGDIPNIFRSGMFGGGRANEGRTVLMNGTIPPGRAGSPASPGAVEAGPQLEIDAGEAVRLQLINAATSRFFRLRLTDAAGTQIPIYRVGGQGGLLDTVRLEGGMLGTVDTEYNSGEIVLAPAERADVVIAIPATTTGVATLWTVDYHRTGQGFAKLPSTPIMHLDVGSPVAQPFTISAGDPLLTHPSINDPIEDLEALPVDQLLDPLGMGRLGSGDDTIRLTSAGGPGIDEVKGVFMPADGDYTTIPNIETSRYAIVGDVLELTVRNTTNAHHPFHLHGFSFQPVAFLDNSDGSTAYAFAHNEFVDNLNIPNGYSLKFRVRLDDRLMADGVTMGGAIGRWFFHCHIFNHAANGMISELVVLPSPTLGTRTTQVRIVVQYDDADPTGWSLHYMAIRDDEDWVVGPGELGDAPQGTVDGMIFDSQDWVGWHTFTLTTTGGQLFGIRAMSASLDSRDYYVFESSIDPREIVSIDNQFPGTAPVSSAWYSGLGFVPGTLVGTSGADLMAGKTGIQEIEGLKGDDWIDGWKAGDKLTGNGGADYMVGGLGNDKMFGRGGDDILVDGEGVDKLTGNSGADIFRFHPSDGIKDRIVDYEDGVDKIHLPGATWGDLVFDTRRPGKVLIRYGSQRLIVTDTTGIDDLSAADFDQTDFIFD